MSSQMNKGIPLSHAPTGTGYKLLELPPELVSLLESENPPVLRLESSSTAGLLKTADKTWSLRQKNTSNALILLGVTGPESSSIRSSQLPTAAGLSAIATVHETVELVPEASNAAAPVTAAKGKWHEKFGRGR